MPATFPAFQTVNRYYLRWRRAGLWDPIWTLLTDDTLEELADEAAEQLEPVPLDTSHQELLYRLPDVVWAEIEAVLPQEREQGRPYAHPRRRIVEAVVYRLQRACSWRKLPACFPPVKTVYGQFSRWLKASVWDQIAVILKDAESLGHLQL